jgi:hypothetical protein
MDLCLEFELALMVTGTCPKHELGIFSGIDYSDQVLWGLHIMLHGIYTGS